MFGGGGFFGDILGKKAIDEGMAGQASSTREANDLLKKMYDDQHTILNPWRASGQTALTGMENADFQRDFTMSDFQKDPGYDFRMQEGAKALERSAAARGGVQNGATLKALTRYNQDFATNEYNNAYNRFNSDRDRRFGRLSSIAGMGFDASKQAVGVSQNYGNQASQNLIGMGNAYAAGNIAKANANQQMLSSLISGGSQAGSAAMMSDKRAKKNIQDAKEDLYKFLDTLSAAKYVYINPEAHGHGVRYSPMAQELEKTPVGKAMVIETSEGKIVDYGSGFGAILAAQVALHERLKKLEAKGVR